MSVCFDIDSARSHFPALQSGHIYADNAGGSQTTKDVVDRISDYLLYTNVQLNVDYSISMQSTQRVSEGRKAAVQLFNAASADQIVFGASSTANMENLMKNLENDILPGEELILMDGEHEANNGGWKKLADRCGALVKYWSPKSTLSHNPYSVKHNLEDLPPLISNKTRIVAFSACSNILGSIVPVKEVSRIVRAEATARGTRKTEISVDCVAYAPHRRMNVQDWGIDYCMLSFYKVYGPHVAALYIRSSLYPQSSRVANELIYGSTGILPHLLSLSPSKNLDDSFSVIEAYEQNLVEPLLNFLTQPVQRARGVMIVGSESGGLTRVPIVSFVVRGERPLESKEIVKLVNQRGGVGIRWYTYFYAGMEPDLERNGVARVSLVHYNTVAEVLKIIEILKDILV